MSSFKIIAYLTVSIAPLALVYLVKKKYKNKLSALAPEDASDYQVIFCSYKTVDCRKHIYRNVPCGPTCSYHTVQFLADYISSAKRNVSMCMYLLTCNQVQKALVQLCKRGIRVRFITDVIMAENPASKILELNEQGVEIKMQPTRCNDLLHHKFCLIDEDDTTNGKMFFGSLNITLQGITANFDTIIFTNDTKTIERYSEEFEYLWSNFKVVQVK